MAKFAFLEIHLDGDFVANAPFGGTMTTDAESDLDEHAGHGPSDDIHRPWLAAVVGLLFLLVLALLVKKKVGDDTTKVGGQSGD